MVGLPVWLFGCWAWWRYILEELLACVIGAGRMLTGDFGVTFLVVDLNGWGEGF